MQNSNNPLFYFSVLQFLASSTFAVIVGSVAYGVLKKSLFDTLRQTIDAQRVALDQRLADYNLLKEKYAELELRSIRQEEKYDELAKENKEIQKENAVLTALNIKLQQENGELKQGIKQAETLSRERESALHEEYTKMKERVRTLENRLAGRRQSDERNCDDD